MKANELIMLLDKVDESILDYDYSKEREPSRLRQAETILHLKYDEHKKIYLIDNIDVSDEIKKSKNWEKLKKILETMREMNTSGTIFYKKEVDEDNTVELDIIKLEATYRMRVEEQVFNLDSILKNQKFKAYLERQISNKL